MRPLFKSYRSVGGHGEAKAARAGARSTHLCPYGGAHEQQDLDGGCARLPPLLQLRAPVRAQVLQIPQLFDDGVVGHAGCVERSDAWRRRRGEDGSLTDAWLSQVRLIKDILTVVIVHFDVQLLPGPLERLPDGLDAGRSTVRLSSETSGWRNVSGFSPGG